MKKTKKEIATKLADEVEKAEKNSADFVAVSFELMKELIEYLMRSRT